ncbi:unnamed protein product [Blepharisma stoltei]|uniref:Uncharacterized protein n=1 Tax=Blepharisma stoltei TaxID=1481888 RepID=A0AAU9KB16_9CILI|nr:unnamed protein product [Blepharisma stoltei]
MVKTYKSRGRPCNPIGFLLHYFMSPKKKDSRSLNQKLTNSFYHNFYNMLKLNLSKDTYDLYSSRFWPKSFLNKDEIKVFTRQEKSYFNIGISRNLRSFYKNVFSSMVDKYAKDLAQQYSEKELEKVFNCKLDSRFDEKAPIRKRIWECLIVHHLANIGKENEETKESQNLILEVSAEAEEYIQETIESQKTIAESIDNCMKLRSEPANNYERPYLNEKSDIGFSEDYPNSALDLGGCYDI